MRPIGNEAFRGPRAIPYREAGSTKEQQQQQQPSPAYPAIPFSDGFGRGLSHGQSPWPPWPLW